MFCAISKRLWSCSIGNSSNPCRKRQEGSPQRPLKCSVAFRSPLASSARAASYLAIVSVASYCPFVFCLGCSRRRFDTGAPHRPSACLLWGRRPHVADTPRQSHVCPWAFPLPVGQLGRLHGSPPGLAHLNLLSLSVTENHVADSMLAAMTPIPVWEPAPCTALRISLGRWPRRSRRAPDSPWSESTCCAV